MPTIQQNVDLIWDTEDENNSAKELKFARYPDEPGVTSCFIFRGKKKDEPRSFQDLNSLCDELDNSTVLPY